MTYLHVVPRGDLIEHEAADECVCGPTAQSVDGGFITIHHALDGRELEKKQRSSRRPPMPEIHTEQTPESEQTGQTATTSALSVVPDALPRCAVCGATSRPLVQRVSADIARPFSYFAACVDRDACFLTFTEEATRGD